MENTFLVYYEYKESEDAKHLNGNTITCKGLAELIHTLKDCEKAQAQNVNIFTVQSQAFML